ncbi:tenascin-X-like [Tyto alba]|uniref:tenascin-X-like n=1 Tax=Tyto alba TaxID=56313 RepID=UPI001C667519|nr:tenascin-X-like [Tyto alba]
MDGWTDGRMDGWTDGWVDGRRDGWMDVYLLLCHLSITAPAEPEEPPLQPTLGELKASHVPPESVELEWSIPKGTFDSFTVQYRDAQGQPQVLPVDGGSRTVTVPGLSPSRRYKFNLYGAWGRKRLGPVSTDAVTAPAEPEEHHCSQPWVSSRPPTSPLSPWSWSGASPRAPLTPSRCSTGCPGQPQVLPWMGVPAR